jgi:DNA invertase Pin-like site-specific DNA recombinase
MLHIYAALAEKERSMISERTRDALAQAKQRGIGSVPILTPLSDGRERGLMTTNSEQMALSATSRP